MGLMNRIRHYMGLDPMGKDTFEDMPDTPSTIDSSSLCIRCNYYHAAVVSCSSDAACRTPLQRTLDLGIFLVLFNY